MNLLGADLPPRLLAAQPDNPSGFWESHELVDIHDAMLASAGSSWKDVAPLSPARFGSDEARAFERQVAELLRRDFARSALFVVKDPRICRLLPFWLRVLRGLEVRPGFVITLRNPLDAAASLEQRNGFLPARSLLLWLRHMLEAERGTRGEARSIVSYDHLLDDWRGVADRIAGDLGLTWPQRSAGADAEIDAFLSAAHRHHRRADDELKARPDVAEWVKRVYATFMAAAEGEDLAVSALDSVRADLEVADLAFGPLLAESELGYPDLRGELKAARTLVTHREAKVEELRGELEAAAARLAGQEAETGRVSEELQGTVARLARQQAETAGVREELEAAKRAWAAQQADAAQVRVELEAARSALVATEARLRHELVATQRALVETRSVAEGLRFQSIAARAAGHTILESRAWQLTRPLRQLTGMLSYVRDIGLARAVSLLRKRRLVRDLQFQRELAVIDRSGMIDSSWYLARYPDVADADVEPVRHYVLFGTAEGRDPHPLFDTSWYLDRYPDVRRARINPLVHYLLRGAIEGRAPHAPS